MWSRVPEIQIEAVVGHRRDVEAQRRLDNGAQDVMESESAFEHGGFFSRMQTISLYVPQLSIDTQEGISTISPP